MLDKKAKKPIKCCKLGTWSKINKMQLGKKKTEIDILTNGQRDTHSHTWANKNDQDI